MIAIGFFRKSGMLFEVFEDKMEKGCLARIGMVSLS